MSPIYRQLAAVPGATVARHIEEDREVLEVSAWGDVLYVDPELVDLTEYRLDMGRVAYMTTAGARVAAERGAWVLLWRHLQSIQVEAPYLGEARPFCETPPGETIGGPELWAVEPQGCSETMAPAIARAMEIDPGHGVMSKIAAALDYPTTAVARPLRQGMTTALQDRLIARGYSVTILPGPMVRIEAL